MADEFDLTAAVDGVLHALPGAEAAAVRGEPGEVLGLLEARRPDVVFNLCEAPLGRPDLEPHIASLFEWAGVRFTGASSQTLALCRRKDLTKDVLRGAGVAVPSPSVFPCIVKPVDQDGSTGLSAASVCHSDAEVELARTRLGGPAIVEEFLPGREFVVSLWGRTEPDFISIGAVTFSEGLALFTYASKWDDQSPDFVNSRLDYVTGQDPALDASLATAARRSWHAVGARAYLRLDIRLDAAGVPKVIDVNPNPEVSPGVGIHRAVTEAGWRWEEFVRKLVEWA